VLALFKPTAMKKDVLEITPGFLKKLGVKAVLLDIDNTLASYKSHEPINGAVEWVKTIQNAGFKVIVVSNNFEKRVNPIAAKFGLPFITFAMKPLPFGYLRASKILGVKCRECAIIGDQIFTDVMGANLCSMKSVLLEPIEVETGFSYDIRRGLEKGMRKRYNKTIK